VGKAIKSVGNALGFGGGTTPSMQSVNQSFYDISKEIEPAQAAMQGILGQSNAAAGAVNPAQIDVLKQMGLAASGQGPSLAEVQLKAAQDRNLAQQLAAMQSQRGGSTALNQRALLQNQASSGRDLAMQSTLSRLDERNNFLNQANIAQANQRGDVQGKLNLDLMPKDRMLQYETARVQAANQNAQAQAQANAAKRGALFSGISSVVGGMAAGGTGLFAPGKASLPSTPNPGAMTPTESNPLWFSDENLKTDVKSAKNDMSDFLDTLNSTKYKYKDEGHEEGEQYSVMAQDLEKSKVGKNMVVDTPKGKAVDFNKGMAAILASQAELNKRLKNLEKGQGGPVKAADGGLIKKMPGGKAQVSHSYKEGGPVKKDAALDSMKSLIESVRRSKYAGSGANTTQALEDNKVNKEQEDRAKKRNAQDAAIRNLKSGGEVDGPGTPTSDSIPAMLSDGEFVVRAKVASNPAILKFLSKLNSEKATEKDMSALAKALAKKKGPKRE